MAQKKAKGASERVNKKEAVLWALKKLGSHAMPKAIKEEIRREYKIDVSSNYVSTTKADVLKGKSKEATASSAKQPARSGKGTVEWADILDLRDLVDRLGADHLRKLIDMMSR